ncbi:hypothetical protein EAO68_00945 [Streptomyces sp. wa22]|nr:hypothetical protein EAO68_00945 [Streptomyces sp. wa22]
MPPKFEWSGAERQERQFSIERCSLGSLLYRRALGEAVATAPAVRDGAPSTSPLSSQMVSGSARTASAAVNTSASEYAASQRRNTRFSGRKQQEASS